MSDISRADALKLAAETVRQLGDRYSSGNDANFEQRVTATIKLTYLLLEHDNVVLESAPEEWFDNDTPEPAPRRFKDKDGGVWEETEVGALAFVDDDGPALPGMPKQSVWGMWGPLTEITE